MLSTTTKPYNPNKKQSLGADWDKLDLCSFLQNINSINIDKNDISYTGNDYEKATKREIVAEIIRTINATHYNSLLGMKDIIIYNNNILKITKSRNKSIDICNKQIKLLNKKINRFEFLLVQAADLLPDPKSIPKQQTPQQMEKIHNILDFTSCIDDDLPTTASSNITINQTQIPSKQIQTDNISAIVRDKYVLTNQPQSSTPNTITSTKQKLVPINTVIKIEPSIRQAIDDNKPPSKGQTIDDSEIKLNVEKIKDKPKPVKKNRKKKKKLKIHKKYKNKTKKNKQTKLRKQKHYKAQQTSAQTSQESDSDANASIQLKREAAIHFAKQNTKKQVQKLSNPFQINTW